MVFFQHYTMKVKLQVSHEVDHVLTGTAEHFYIFTSWVGRRCWTVTEMTLLLVRLYFFGKAGGAAPQLHRPCIMARWRLWWQWVWSTISIVEVFSITANNYFCWLITSSLFVSKSGVRETQYSSEWGDGQCPHIVCPCACFMPFSSSTIP